MKGFSYILLSTDCFRIFFYFHRIIFTLVKRCKSVYRFDGKDSSELSFQVGEIIEVHKISEVGWWKGRLRGNRGWFPSSYVMVCFLLLQTLSFVVL